MDLPGNIDLSTTLQHLPPTAHLLAAAGVLIGAVLWLAGEKILRMVFAALGSLIGAAMGFFLLPTVAPATAFGFPSPHVGLVAGGLIGLILGILLYRFAVAILLAGGLGIAALLLSAALVQFQPLGTPGDFEREDYHEAPASLQAPPPPGDAEAAEGPQATPEVDPPAHLEDAEVPERDRIREALETVRPVAERVRSFLHARGEEFADAWGQLTGRQQAIVISSTLAGVITGFLLGMFFPRRSAAAAKAMVGAAVVLASGLWLWRAIDAPGAERLVTLVPAVWLAIWAVTALLGFFIQSLGSIRFRRRA
jgi:hypothetical protein